MTNRDIAHPAWRELREWAVETPLNISVSGECMSPVLEDGDRVEVRGAATYWPGDIVVVKRSNDLPPSVHRLLGSAGFGGWSRCLTRGDNAGTVDSPCCREQIVGKVTALVGSDRPLKVSLRRRILSLFGFLCFVGKRLPQKLWSSAKII